MTTIHPAVNFDFEKYLRDKASAAGLRLIGQSRPDLDSIVFVLSKGPDENTSISISGMEILQNNEMQIRDLCDRRFDQSHKLLCS